MLGILADPRASATLARALRDEAPAVRRVAATALGLLRGAANTAPTSVATRPASTASTALPSPSPSPSISPAPPKPTQTILDADSAYGEDLGPAPADPRAHCDDALRLYARNPTSGRRRLYELVWRVESESAKEDAAEIVRTLAAPTADALARARRCCRMARLQSASKTAALRKTFECLGQTFGRRPASTESAGGPSDD